MIAGHIIAPPIPIRARAASSTAMLVAAPPTSENAAKIVQPMKKTRRRPNMSASRPPVTIATPKTSAYPLITHCEVVMSALNVFSIDGIATESAVKSFAITSTATAMAASPRRAARSSDDVGGVMGILRARWRLDYRSDVDSRRYYPFLPRLEMENRMTVALVGEVRVNIERCLNKGRFS